MRQIAINTILVVMCLFVLWSVFNGALTLDENSNYAIIGTEGNHHGSPKYTDGGASKSLLKTDRRGNTDSKTLACDGDPDPFPVGSEVWDNGHSKGIVWDNWGGGCTGWDFRGNAEGHRVCQRTNIGIICGGWSVHD